MSPLVSVIVAAYNEERRIGECLDSLRSQTYEPLEVVVGNDGSHDRTSDVVRGYQDVALLDLPHRGKAPTVNEAVGRARGEIVVFADADLVYDPGYVAALVEPIIRGECEGTSHATETVANPENRWSRCQQLSFGLPLDLRFRLSDEEVAAGTTIFRAIRKCAFERVRGFEDTGFTDDATLAPKLGFVARFVRTASCAHYNPETLGEVFRRGRWMGKSHFVKHGARSVAHLLPPFIVLRATRSAWEFKSWEMIPYSVVGETGSLVGVVENIVASWRQGLISPSS